MERKRHSFLWIVSASFFLAAVVLFVLFRFVVTPPATADTTPDPLYTIGVWRGYVAVFEGEQTYPKQIYDMPVSGLPQELQQTTNIWFSMARARVSTLRCSMRTSGHWATQKRTSSP